MSVERMESFDSTPALAHTFRFEIGLRAFPANEALTLWLTQ
jgi:hypothetical protein